MRRTVLVCAALVALTACGGSPRSAPHSTAAAAAVRLAKPVVTVMPYHLKTGVGRSALFDTACLLLPNHTCNGAIVAGGLVAGDSTTDVVQLIDFDRGSVTSLAPLAVPVHDTAGALDSAMNPLVIGGGNTSEQKVVQQYVGGKWVMIGDLPTTRSDLSALTTGSQDALVLGGYDGTTPAIGGALKSTDGRHWSDAGSLAVPVRYAAAALDAHQVVWLFGGEVAGAEQDVVQSYNPANGVSQVVAHLPMRLGHMSAAAVGDRILVLGGRTDASSGAMTDAMWWFDPATHTFTDAGRLPYPVADAMLARSHPSGFLYLIGGESPHPISTILKIQVNR